MVRAPGAGLIFSVVSCSCGNFVTLLDDEAFFSPVESRGNELVDVDVAAAMEVDGVSELGKFLRARACAAPEGFFGRVVGAPVSGGEREEILLQPLSVLRAQPAVEERALVIIHPARIAGPAEDEALKLHQIVGHTALGVGPGQCSLELPGGRFPMLIETGVANDVVARGRELRQGSTRQSRGSDDLR